MLHILWLILKWILILLGILIGLALLAVLLILFCPVRYRGKAWKKRDEELKEAHVSGEVSWLFRGVSVRAALKNGKIEKEFYIFGISLSKLKKIFGRKKKPKTGSRTGKKASSKKQGSSSEKKETVSDTQIKEKQPVIIKEEQELPEVEEITGTEIPEETQKKTGEISENRSVQDPAKPEEGPVPEDEIPEDMFGEDEDPETVFAEEEFSEDELTDDILPDDGKDSGRIRSFLLKIREKIKAIADKIRVRIQNIMGIPEKIRKKIRNFVSKIRKFRSKINWWKEFINHPKTREAISLVWKDAKKLIHHILPTKITGKVTFGSEDPGITGTVLAVLGMTIPFHKNRITVTPLFDGENTLEGEVTLKGRIYGVVLLKMAAELYFNKNIKYVIHRWRHKEVNHGERE